MSGVQRMSDAAFKMSGTARPAVRSTRFVLAVAAVALLSGCAFQKRDSVTVGAVPDDYRTNHPIIIADKEETLDLPVGASDRGATASQRASLEGFLANYDKTAAPVLNIIAPSGSGNDVAAADAAHDFANIARKNGVPENRIMIASYRASPEEVSAPVRVSFSAMRAQTDKCGRWPEDILADQREQALREFRLLLSEQHSRADRQSGGLARAAQADADRSRQPRTGDRRLPELAIRTSSENIDF